MTPALSIAEPLDNALLATGDTNLSIDVFDPTPDSARLLNATVNGTLVLTVLGAAVTYLNAAYTYAASYPATNVTRHTLTHTASWADPFAILMVAGYRPAPSSAILTAQVSAICATLTVNAIYPILDQSDVDPGTDLALAVTSSATIQDGALTVAGQTALSQLGATDPVWNYPDFKGRAFYASGTLSLTVNPRRTFPYEARVPASISLTLTDGSARSVQQTRTYAFYVRQRRTPVFNPALRFTRVDQLFEQAPASETFRYVLRGALQTRPAAAPYIVLIYSRILRSSLRSVASQFNRADLEREVVRLVPEDLPDIAEVDGALSAVDILWEPALEEARALGIDPPLLELLAKTYAAPYPQERAGAVAALMLVQAALRPAP